MQYRIHSYDRVATEDTLLLRPLTAFLLAAMLMLGMPIAMAAQPLQIGLYESPPKIFTDASGAPLDGLGDGPYVQLWPHVHGTDAMFFALLRRR